MSHSSFVRLSGELLFWAPLVHLDGRHALLPWWFRRSECTRTLRVQRRGWRSGLSHRRLVSLRPSHRYSPGRSGSFWPCGSCVQMTDVQHCAEIQHQELAEAARGLHVSEHALCCRGESSPSTRCADGPSVVSFRWSILREAVAREGRWPRSRTTASRHEFRRPGTLPRWRSRLNAVG